MLFYDATGSEVSCEVNCSHLFLLFLVRYRVFSRMRREGGDLCDSSPEYETEEVWDGEQWLLVRREAIRAPATHVLGICGSAHAACFIYVVHILSSISSLSYNISHSSASSLYLSSLLHFS